MRLWRLTNWTLHHAHICSDSLSACNWQNLLVRTESWPAYSTPLILQGTGLGEEIAEGGCPGGLERGCPECQECYGHVQWTDAYFMRYTVSLAAHPMWTMAPKLALNSLYSIFCQSERHHCPLLFTNDSGNGPEASGMGPKLPWKWTLSGREIQNSRDLSSPGPLWILDFSPGGPLRLTTREGPKHQIVTR